MGPVVDNVHLTVYVTPYTLVMLASGEGVVRGRLQFKFLPTPSDVFDFSKKLGKAFIKST